MYLIQRGCVRVTERVELEDRRHIQPGICDLGANEVFGELSLFDPGPQGEIESIRIKDLPQVRHHGTFQEAHGNGKSAYNNKEPVHFHDFCSVFKG